MNKQLKNLEPVTKDKLSLFEIEDPFEAGEYHILHIAYNKNVMAAGGVSNCGFLPTFWIEYDKDFSLDENLQSLYELINEAIYAGELDELKGLIEL